MTAALCFCAFFFVWNYGKTGVNVSDMWLIAAFIILAMKDAVEKVKP